MTALTILWAALRNILADIPQMLRIFALPGGLMIASVATLEWLRTFAPGAAPYLAGTVAMMVLLYCGLWSMVNLHRRILLREQFGWLPRRHGRAMLGYAIMAVLIGAVVAAAAFALVLVLNQVAMLARPDLMRRFPIPAFLLLMLVQWTGVIALALGLFSILPGLAIGQPLRGPARHGLPVILLIALTLGALSIARIMLPLFVASRFELTTLVHFMGIMRVLGPIVGILAPIFGLSLLTVLYATYIRRSPR